MEFNFGGHGGTLSHRNHLKEALLMNGSKQLKFVHLGLNLSLNSVVRSHLKQTLLPQPSNKKILKIADILKTKYYTKTTSIYMYKEK